MTPWLFHLLLASTGLAVTTLVAAVVLWVWRRQPIASYRLGVFVVLASLALPLAQLGMELGEVSTARLATGAWTPPAVVPSEPRSELVQPTPHVADERALDVPLLGVLLQASQALRESEPTQAAATDVRVPQPVRATPILLALYLVGLAVALMGSARRLWRTRELLRAAAPIDDAHVRAAWDEVAAGSPLRGRARLVRSRELRAPACFGLLTPTVVLPAGDPRAERPDVLRCVLLHELLHLERRDTWVLLLQEVFRVLFWFHPAARWLVRKVDELREVSCDQLVVQRTGGRLRYASALVEYAAVLGSRSAAAAPRDPVILAWSSSKPQLKRRIEMLLTKRTTKRAGWMPVTAAVFAGLWSCQLAMAGTPAEAAPGDTAPEPAAAVAPLETAPESGLARAPEPAQDGTLGLSVDRVGAALAAQLDRDADDVLLVERVVAGSVAQAAGVRRFDVIVAIDGHGPVSVNALRVARRRVEDGGTATLTVARAGANVNLTLGAREGTTEGAQVAWSRPAFREAMEHYRDVGGVPNTQDLRELYTQGREYYDQVDRERFRADMRDALAQYNEALARTGRADVNSRYAEILRSIEADPDRYLDAGRRYFREKSPDEVIQTLDQTFRKYRDDSEAQQSDLEDRLPRPRTHLVTYHGVLAPAAAWRDLVVPGSPTRSLTSARTPRQRLTWAELLKRVFAIDALTCPDCGGPRKLIALIHDGLVVRKILAHLGLSTEPPPLAPARAPPEPEFAW